MPKLKNLSGKDVVKIFKDLGFVITGQKGSHIKLKRIIDNNFKQILTIPSHKELDRGTIKAIYNQSLIYISEKEIRKFFYN